MARNFTFRLTADGVDKFKQDLAALGPAGEAAFNQLKQSSPQLVDALKRAEEQAVKTRERLNDLGKEPASAMKALAAGADEVSSRFNSFAGRVPVVGGMLQALGPAGTVAAAGIGATVGMLVAGAKEAANYEQSLNRLSAVLKATGQSSGLTTGQLAALADEMESTTNATEEGVLDAAAALATFRSVSGSTFTQTLRLGQDIAAVFGGDLRSSVVQLGKALEDPIQGMTALRRIGISFTESQRDQIKVLVESGRALEAQTLILATIEKQVGGAGAGERVGLNGATKGLKDAWGDLLKEIGKTQGFMTDAVDAVGRGTKAMADAISEAGRRARLEAGIESREAILAAGPGNSVASRLRFNAAQAELPGLISKRDDQDAAKAAAEGEATNAAAAAAAAAEAERLEARRKKLNEIADSQERLIEINKKAIAQRAEEAAADEAVAKAKKDVADLSAGEEAAIRRRAILAVQAKKAVEDEAEAEKKRLQFTERVLDTLRELDEKRQEGIDTVDRQVEGIRRETEVLGIDESGRRILTELMQAENDLRRAGIDLQSEEAQARLENVRAAAEEREAKRTVVEAQKKAAEDAKREARQATDDVVRYTADRMADLFSETKGGWKRMWENMKQTAISMAARIGAEAIIRWPATQIMNSIYGVSGGGATAGGSAGMLGGLFNMFGGGASGGGGAAAGGGMGGVGGIASLMPNPSLFFGGTGGGPSMISNITSNIANVGRSIGNLFSGGGANVLGGLGGDVGVDLGFAAAETAASASGGLSGVGASLQGLMGAIPVWGWISLAATIMKQIVGGSDPRSVGGVIDTLLLPSLEQWMQDPFRANANLLDPIGTALGDLSGSRTIAGILNPWTLLGGFFGFGKQGFSGGQVNLGVDDKGNLIPTQTGFKDYDAEQALKTTRDFANAINMLFDQLGLSLTTGSANLGNLAFGQTTQTVNDTLGMILKGGRLTSDSPELVAKIQGMSLEGTPEEVMQRLTDLVTIFRLLNDVAQDGTLNPEPLTQTEQVLKSINERFEDLSKKAEQFGFSLTDLENARVKAIESLATGFNKSMVLQLLAITNPYKEVMERLKDTQEARLKEAIAAGADLVLVEKLSAAERKKVLEQINQPLQDLFDSMSLGQGILSPSEQLRNAETRFTDLRAQVLGGDYNARDDLAQAAQQLDEISRSSFASGADYFQRRDFIMATLRNVLGLDYMTGTGLLNAPGAAPPFMAALSTGTGGSGFLSAGGSAAMTAAANGSISPYETEMVRLMSDSNDQLTAMRTSLKDLSSQVANLASSIDLLARSKNAA